MNIGSLIEDNIKRFGEYESIRDYILDKGLNLCYI